MAFRVADLYLPSPEEMLETFSAGAELDGTVIDFSDAGGVSQAFAVVRVVLERTVVVPVDKLKVIAGYGVNEPRS